jgi:hypothetical protein
MTSERHAQLARQRRAGVGGEALTSFVQQFLLHRLAAPDDRPGQFPRCPDDA